MAEAGEVFWMGVDLGTQGVRVTAVTGDGRVKGEGSHPLASRRQGNRHEQDPSHWWPALAAASRKALAGLPAAAIGGVAVCSTSGTMLLTDVEGKPLTPALMYDDGRAADEATHIETTTDLAIHLGYKVQPAWALPKLLWLLNQPDGCAADARLSHQADHVLRHLIDHQTPTDQSHALKTGYDLAAGRWPSQLFDDLGVPESILPDVVPSGTFVGVVCEQASEQTGIPCGVPVVAGMTDGCAGQLAAGAVEVGSWNSVLGTTLVLKGVTSQPLQDPLGVVYSHRSPDGTWLPGGASSVGAAILSNTFPGENLTHLTEVASSREPTTVAYPLAGKGERFPFLAPQAEGFVLGVSVDPADQCAALMEGVAFVERLCLDYMDMCGAPTGGQMTFTGGASQNTAWNQLRCDVLGRPVRLPAGTGSAMGMAILAAAACQEVTLEQATAKMVTVRQELFPRPERQQRLMSRFFELVDELEARGWAPAPLAANARRRGEG